VLATVLADCRRDRDRRPTCRETKNGVRCRTIDANDVVAPHQVVLVVPYDALVVGVVLYR